MFETQPTTETETMQDSKAIYAASKRASSFLPRTETTTKTNTADAACNALEAATAALEAATAALDDARTACDAARTAYKAARDAAIADARS